MEDLIGMEFEEAKKLTKSQNKIIEDMDAGAFMIRPETVLVRTKNGKVTEAYASFI